MAKDKAKQLEDLKAKIKNPAVQKSIEEKQKYLNKPISK